MTPDAALGRAVERLYDDLGTVARPVRLDGLGEYLSTEDRAILTGSAPLRSMPTYLLDRFASTVVAGTAGRPAELSHYLPRVLECVVLVETTLTELPALCSGVARTDSVVRAAVSAFLDEVWPAVLRCYPVIPGPVELLAAAAALGHDREAWLTGWAERLGGLAAARHLADLVWVDGVIDQGRWRPAGGGLVCAEGFAWDDVTAWLSDPALRCTMSAHADAATDRAVVQALSDAGAAIDLYCERPGH